MCTDGHVRLVGGQDTNEGRVEICSNGVWGSVYGGGGWDSLDASVVCRQLGYQRYSSIDRIITSYFDIFIYTCTCIGVEPFRSSSEFGAGTGPILFAYLNCDGTEPTLADCSSSFFSFGASHSSDVGVRCQRTTTASEYMLCLTLL